MLGTQVRDPLETYFSFNRGLSHWISNQYEALKTPVRLASPLEWVNIWYIMPQMDPDWRSVLKKGYKRDKSPEINYTQWMSNVICYYIQLVEDSMHQRKKWLHNTHSKASVNAHDGTKILKNHVKPKNVLTKVCIMYNG